MEEMRREREREYLPTFPPLLQTANFLFTITDDNDESRKGVKKNFFSSSSFFFTFSFFFLYFLLLFAFQFSIFFSFPIPSTYIITERQAEWLNIYRKDKYAPYTFTFLAACFSFCLSSFIHHDQWSLQTVYFSECMFCFSNITLLSVCFKRMFFWRCQCLVDLE
jgi:hypothetical protein